MKKVIVKEEDWLEFQEGCSYYIVKNGRFKNDCCSYKLSKPIDISSCATCSEFYCPRLKKP